MEALTFSLETLTRAGGHSASLRLPPCTARGGRQASFRRGAAPPSCRFTTSPSPLLSRLQRPSHGRLLVAPGRGARPGVAGATATGRGAKSVIPTHGFDYYELLGVDPEATPEDVKRAYRHLQKRCHPDVAGREDMAVLLNEAYSVLSDPISRFMYDQLRVTWLRDETFSGRPVYSTWHGSEEETAAVFVDEVGCIGCLKCAEIASPTFAIECKHGKARAVRQWANQEATINEAIQACPVNCIKWVERSKLAALEHIMSLMPRPCLYSLMVGGDGVRIPDVYSEAEKFLQKRKSKGLEVENTQKRRDQAQGAYNAIHGWWGAPFGSPSARGVALTLSDNPGAAGAAARAARAARESRFKAGDDFVPDDLRALHNAASASRTAPANGFFNLRVGDDEEEYWNPARPFSFVDTAQKAKSSKPSQTPQSPGAPGPDTSPATGTEEVSKNGVQQSETMHTMGAAAAAASAAGVGTAHKSSAPSPQFIALDEWPDFREEMKRQKMEPMHHVLSLLPLLLSVAAGAYVWLAPNSVDISNQAAALAHGEATFGVAPLPPEVVASLGMRMALSMAVWYAMGSAVSQSLRMVFMFLHRTKGQE